MSLDKFQSFVYVYHMYRDANVTFNKRTVTFDLKTCDIISKQRNNKYVIRTTHWLLQLKSRYEKFVLIPRDLSRSSGTERGCAAPHDTYKYGLLDEDEQPVLLEFQRHIGAKQEWGKLLAGE